MKTFRFLICVTALSVSLIPLVATAADSSPSGTNTTPPADSALVTQQQYDTQMQRMRDMHERMMKARTPAEHQKLMNENMKLMQGSMAMMHGNANMQSGCMDMMGDDHHGMGMMGHNNDGSGMHGNCMGSDSGHCMNMMNMMMQLMQDQQNANAKTR